MTAEPQSRQPDGPESQESKGPVYTFSDDLWDGLKHVVQRADSGSKTLSRVAKFMKEKAALDKYYAVNLKKLISKAAFNEAPDGSNSVQAFMLAFDGLTQTFSVNHEILAAKLLEQLSAPLQQLADGHDRKFKGLTADATRYNKMYKNNYQNLVTSKIQCQKACAEHRQAWDRYQKAVQEDAPKEQLEAVGNKAVLCRQKAVAADEKYVAAVSQMRSFRAKYDNAMSNLLKKYQEMETQRIEQLHKEMTHYMTIMQQMLQSQQKTTQSVLKILTSVDAEADINSFILTHKTGKSRPPLPQYHTYPGHPLHMDENKDQFGADREDGMGIPLEEKSDELIRAEQEMGYYMDRILAEGELSDDEGKILSGLLKVPEGRVAFATVLNHQRSVTGNVQLSKKGYQTLADVVLNFLDEARAVFHVEPVMKIMILAQTFYLTPDGISHRSTSPTPTATPRKTSDEKEAQEKFEMPPEIDEELHHEKKVYLQNAVKHHSIWKDIRFWEESFFTMFQNKLQTQIGNQWRSDAEQQEIQQVQRNVCFSCLGTFAHNMCDFGMDPEKVMTFVKKIASINELTPEHLSMLLSMPCLHSVNSGSSTTSAHPPITLKPELESTLAGSEPRESAMTLTRPDLPTSSRTVSSTLSDPSGGSSLGLGSGDSGRTFKDDLS